jgi:hypothetical protein
MTPNKVNAALLQCVSLIFPGKYAKTYVKLNSSLEIIFQKKIKKISHVENFKLKKIIIHTLYHKQTYLAPKVENPNLQKHRPIV